MNASYRLGLSVVLVTVALSAVACLALATPRPDRGPMGERVGDLDRSLGPFELVERSGKRVTEADLADRVWIAAFVFSRCNASCPIISKTMKDFQAELADSNVRLASITVDPEHDSPEVLREFASRYAADPDRWWYLTGPRNVVYDLILDRFRISVAESAPADRKEGAEAVAHSNRLVLLGPGNRVLGTYVSTDEAAMGRLLEAARREDKLAAARRMGWVMRLPAINASLNASCAALLVLGWTLIRKGQIRAHATVMTTAIAVSALFLSCYLVYHYFVGSVAFRGVGPVRLLYLSILLSHTILAVAVVPLVALTVYRAWRGRYREHSRIARVTFPIWLYVSITGVVVYWMLYQMPVAATSL